MGREKEKIKKVDGVLKKDDMKKVDEHYRTYREEQMTPTAMRMNWKIIRASTISPCA